MRRARYFLLIFLALASANALADAPAITTLRLPDGAIQPRLVRQGDDVLLLYFQRESAELRNGHLMLSRYDANENRLLPGTKVHTEPVKHNDQIGRADIAVDSQGNIHVAWLDMNPPGYYYARSTDGGETFTPPRSLVSDYLEGVETAPAVASHGSNVSVAWHAGDLADEASRRVYAVVSRNHGESFSDEVSVSDSTLGACACCAMSTEYDSKGNFTLAYRSAIDHTGRHMQVLREGRIETVGRWELDYCPVTSSTLSQGWLAFETDGRIYQWHGSEAQPVTAEASRQRQKHPAIAINGKGQRLIAWGEAGGYFTGGTLAFALFSPGGGRLDALHLDDVGTSIPEFSVVAAAALPGDNFLLVY